MAKIWCLFFVCVMWSERLGITTTYHHSQTFILRFSGEGRFAVRSCNCAKLCIQREKCPCIVASVQRARSAGTTRTSKDVVMVVSYQIHAILSSGNVARPRMIDSAAAAMRPILKKFPRSHQRLLPTRQDVLDRMQAPWMVWRGQRLPVSELPKWRDDLLMGSR